MNDETTPTSPLCDIEIGGQTLEVYGEYSKPTHATREDPGDPETLEITKVNLVLHITEDLSPATQQCLRRISVDVTDLMEELGAFDLIEEKVWDTQEKEDEGFVDPDEYDLDDGGPTLNLDGFAKDKL